MAGEINFGILNTNAPMQAFNALNEGAANRRKSRLEELAAQQAEQQFSDEAAYRDAYKQTGGDSNQLLNALAQKGLYKQANEIKKQQLEAEAKRATMDKDLSVVGKNKVEAESGQFKITQEKKNKAIQDIAAFNSAEEAKSSLYMHVQKGDVSDEHAKLIMRGMPKDNDPSKFREWQLNMLRNIMTPKDQLDNKLNNEKFDYQQRNDADNRGVTIRGQNMTDSRVRASQAQSERHFQVGQANTRAQNGKAPMGYRFTTDGSLEAIPGGPADAKAQALSGNRAAGVADVDSAVATLRDAYDRLEKGGGITSTKKGAIGNLAASSSSSVVGQAVGRALGTNNQSARNDIAMTRPALLASLMKATGMSAKQMDSNAELKLWMATATDPTLDVESNRRALSKIEQKYLGNGARTPQGTNDIHSQADAILRGK